MARYWIHCRDCGNHGEVCGGQGSRTDEHCGYCQSIEITGCDEGAEKGCLDCQEIDETEKRNANARRVIAMKTRAGGKSSVIPE